MCRFHGNLRFWILSLVFCLELQGQENPLKKIVIIPFHSIGVDSISTSGAESILRMEVESLNTFELISQKTTLQNIPDDGCAEAACALEIGRLVKADQVIMCKLVLLGEKIIVQYTLLDVHLEKSIIQDRLTATDVEDLDEVLKRVAMSITQVKSAEQTAEVGAITDKETHIQRRRASRKLTGFSIGYIYPQSGYEDKDRAVAVDFRTGAEIQDYALGMQIFIRKGFGINVYVSRLLSRKDICPYLGGAFGFHWVKYDQESVRTYDDGYGYSAAKKIQSDGFELTLNSGVQLFHTFNFRILFNISYSMTFNDLDSRAITFTIGISG